MRKMKKWLKMAILGLIVCFTAILGVFLMPNQKVESNKADAATTTTVLSFEKGAFSWDGVGTYKDGVITQGMKAGSPSTREKTGVSVTPIGTGFWMYIYAGQNASIYSFDYECSSYFYIGNGNAGAAVYCGAGVNTASFTLAQANGVYESNGYIRILILPYSTTATITVDNLTVGSTVINDMESPVMLSGVSGDNTSGAGYSVMGATDGKSTAYVSTTAKTFTVRIPVGKSLDVLKKEYSYLYFDAYTSSGKVTSIASPSSATTSGYSINGWNGMRVKIATSALTVSDGYVVVKMNAEYSGIKCYVDNVCLEAATYTVTLTAGKGISAVSGAGSVEYGKTKAIDATVKAGYTWSKWSDNNTTKSRTITVTGNVNLTAQATVSRIT